MSSFRSLITPAIFFVAFALSSCNGRGNVQNLPQAAPAAASQLIDTNKLKSDVDAVAGALSPGKLPDTIKLKAAARDILSTTASVMSDSGISKMGDSRDPSQKAAQDEMKKIRDASGLTPAALDSLKKAAAQLQSH